MTKDEILQRLEAVCNTLDGGIMVSGVKNASNLAGCYSVLQELLGVLRSYDFVDPTMKASPEIEVE